MNDKPGALYKQTDGEKVPLWKPLVANANANANGVMTLELKSFYPISLFTICAHPDQSQLSFWMCSDETRSTYNPAMVNHNITFVKILQASVFL